MNIIGNTESQELIKNNLFRFRTNVISGPSHIGKMTFIQTTIESLVDSNDVFIADPGIESTREAIQFSRSAPCFGDRKVLILNADSPISDASQDTYLKLCEEPPSYLSIYFVIEDYYSLFPTLRSRFYQSHNWSRLTMSQMDIFINSDSFSPDKDASRLCDGRPGLYGVISSNPDLKTLFDEIVGIYRNAADPLLSPIPRAILDMKDDLKRDAVVTICGKAASSLLDSGVERSRVASLLRFASIMKRIPSLNSEIHWTNSLLM